MGEDAPAKAASVDISVLVPVLNEAEHLSTALSAMREQRDCGELEVLVIDGGSTDSTVKIATEAHRRDPRIRLLDNPERRTPNALNIGLRAARGKFVARMDAHTIYPDRYLAEGIARLERGDVVWASGPQLAEGAGTWSRRVAAALGTPLGVGGAGFRSLETEEIEVDSGFTGVWRREFLDSLGGWDEGWPINQDGELAARIREMGGRIVCVPGMAAAYVPRNSLASLRRQYWRYGQYKAKTCGRHPHSMRRSHVLAPGLVLVLAMTPVGGRVGRFARLGTLLYGAAVARAAWRSSDSIGDRLGVAGVLVTMHTSWGAGFFVGSARFGLPLRALIDLL